MPRATPPKAAPVALIVVTTRLFSDDIAHLKEMAQTKRSEWQVELRQLVHRALKDKRLTAELFRGEE